MNDIREFWAPVFVFILVLALLIVGIVAAVQYTDKPYCDHLKAIMPDQTFSYNFWTGCMIKLPDGTYSHASDYLNEGRFNLKVENTNK